MKKAVRSKWIWLRFCDEKETQLEYMDARHYNTVQDILDSFNYTKSLKLYDTYGRELNSQERILSLREYTVKQWIKWKVAQSSI